MTDDEFIKKMKDLGQDDEYINSILRHRDEEKEQGIICPIEVFILSNSYVKIDEKDYLSYWGFHIIQFFFKDIY